ncbi:type II toxin-antitoxin system RelE/ParE family toxin [Klebsiella sp. RHBSTW-00484]|uniref:type II toxin-antitoxin system RelE family toxin n=1 Tax=unclassified Klebsiella TaxID=2608929 RepID=UPI0015E5056B|nr:MULTISPECIES: type II toxin-antitoxin system RelE/ParE family toxin [unclassified Klebsiella]MBA7846041.1 type II toxin-antitoxin system RelE/ParE family toxin [Klebsiella sp. RHBSTW-00465]QLO38034.1 type II toxin-antitoxin system RelE/ParE family toxin [Klebsiella sp. RHBSTW-00484]QLT77554.1 type II toxin-antitoxin system RelE/ParE family toxin [Klebsiella sp. RHBSTW-00464]
MIIWSKVAKKELANIDYRYQERIKSRLADLGDRSGPRPDVRKLTIPVNHYRLRVGDYRVIFTRQGLTLRGLFIVSVKRRTSTTYLHEENMPYGCSDN